MKDNFQVNVVQCLIKDDKNRIFRIGFRISNLLLSNPYADCNTVLSQGVTEDDKIVFKIPQPGYFETVRVNKDMVGSRILRRYAIVANECGDSLIVKYDTPEEDKKIFFTHDGDVFETIGSSSPYEVEYGSGKRKVSEGEFVWLWEDPPQEDPSQIKLDFDAKPFDPDLSQVIEEAKIKGKETVRITRKDGIHVVINLVNGKMFQVRESNPFFFRRVWRVGSTFQKKLQNQHWPTKHKFRDYAVEVPSQWGKKEEGAFSVVELDSSKDRTEYDFVMSKIRASLAYRNTVRSQLGAATVPLQQSLRPDSPMAQVIRYENESGHVQRVAPKAFHVAAIMRIEKPGPFKTYCVGKNEILNSRGSRLRAQPCSEYLTSNPLPTHDTGLDTKVNEEWLFMGGDAKTAYALLEKGADLNIRNSPTDRSFGAGIYLTDDIVRVCRDSPCPMCGGGGRRGTTPCICSGRNFTHPVVVFLARAALGNMMLTRDLSQFRFHGEPGSFVPPTPLFKKGAFIYVWYDEEDTEQDVRRIIPSLTANQDQYVFKPMRLPVQPVIGELDLKSAMMMTPLNIFFAKKATRTSPGYAMLSRYVQTWPPLSELQSPTFAFALDNEASPGAVVVAQELSNQLKRTGATTCLYMKKDVTLESLLERHRNNPNILALYQNELSDVPAADRKIELPDLKKISGQFDTVDSVFIEDVIHCKPAEVLRHPVAAPSLFKAEQHKSHEFVVFNQNKVYLEYAILLYQYENEEAMREHMDKEYPKNRHGIAEEKSPLYFLFRDRDVATSLEPKIPEEVPPPDEASKPKSPTTPQKNDGCFSFKS